MLKWAAIVAVVLLGIICIFQIALALGAPWGRLAWGGSNPGTLPVRLRVASAFAGLILYPSIILLVLSSADLIDVEIPGAGSTAMWVLAVFFTLGAIANFVSRSKAERVWGPLSLAVALCCVVIARSI